MRRMAGTIASTLALHWRGHVIAIVAFPLMVSQFLARSAVVDLLAMVHNVQRVTIGDHRVSHRAPTLTTSAKTARQRPVSTNLRSGT
jgi:hypothetical protein